MPELAARPAWAGLDLPIARGGVTLAALPETAVFSIAPFRGRAAAAGDAIGAALPPPGRWADVDGVGRLIWAGLDQWLLRGALAEPALARRLADDAAVTDQSDGWSAFALTGAGAADVLARLVPLDVSQAAFPPGSAARTELRHMLSLVLARPHGFEIHVMRSFTRSAVHEIEAAMRAVAARARAAVD